MVDFGVAVIITMLFTGLLRFLYPDIHSLDSSVSFFYVSLFTMLPLFGDALSRMGNRIVGYTVIALCLMNSFFFALESKDDAINTNKKVFALEQELCKLKIESGKEHSSELYACLYRE